MFKENHRYFLKVKIKSLAEEARIIRFEEKKARRTALLNELYLHRIIDVREECRAALLAYGYLRGKPLCKIEPRRDKYTADHIDRRAHQIVKKFGTKAAYDNFNSWLYAAV